ncbi:hypothetical protein SPRG_22357 [Saprolegnia parasitica CBS 223.65]|uniref:Transmembrane protein n=1 Tax=Saprolegnia parasitica (strain CBS 223.65) TaxID=695850 RepID=A0A067BXX1_SAPPC|nr:hypothetical protein SPRG_22357 [Saprolegnia parasitica CBS 223.65]KDO19156.1 hypothetical protein SPRG_22357 [Saprolegnia parasitica CBS 223.65]|eukprot:XP_012210126.1 hypothetical protein SPRG_22357 [Saprolegnia parasitica CBS 223.65]
MATTQKELGQMDLQERVSYIQSATKDKDVDGDYADAKTPGELEDGALVAGGALSLVSREALALFSQYFAIGILYGMLPGMQYSVFQNYLKMEGYQVSAYGWFFTGVPLADNVPAGIRFIVATYCAVEIADIGNEGATYGLVTTISNLASPFASVIYKLIDSYFDVSMDQMAEDDNHVRWEVTYCYFISYACKLAALGWLFLLPPQKEAMQELKKRGQTSKLAGALLVAIFFIALTFSVTTNFMSVYPSTKCYRIAGGKGTVNGSCPIKK